jgi:hypothetical protein
MSPLFETLQTQTLPSVGSNAPAGLYGKIQKIAIDGLRDVETFKRCWTSDEAQELWKRTQTERCPPGSDTWRVDYVKALKESKVHRLQQMLDAEAPSTDSRDMKDVVKEFREQHPTIKLQLENSTDATPFNIKVAGMAFLVTSTGSDKETEYKVQQNSGSTSSQLQDGILKQLNKRRSKGNLEYLLVRTQNHVLPLVDCGLSLA